MAPTVDRDSCVRTPPASPGAVASCDVFLDGIREPEDLRELSYADLNELSGEIRDFVVAAVAETGGHLGSNLGAVELTLALHRVFESPRDAILWDTGHQAYVHKLVTGRRSGFAELRQAGGLSGYPSREESRHDYVENSHASTILSYAYGLAVARDAGLDPHRHIVAVIGDGSMTGGMAYEALNNLGHSQRRVIVVLNDNGRSYAPTVSNLTAYAARRPASSSSRRLISRIGDRLHTPADLHPAQPDVRATAAPARGAAARRPVRRHAGREGRRRVQGRRPRGPAAAGVLRGARGPLRRPGRRSRHPGARGRASPTPSSCRPRARSSST